MFTDGIYRIFQGFKNMHRWLKQCFCHHEYVLVKPINSFKQFFGGIGLTLTSSKSPYNRYRCRKCGRIKNNPPKELIVKEGKKMSDCHYCQHGAEMSNEKLEAKT